MQRFILSVLFTAMSVICSAAPSILGSGKWVRFSTSGEGICSITWQEIKDLGLEPGNVRIYGTYGGALPETTGPVTGENLQEVPLWLETGDDGVFGPGGRLYFYAEGGLVRKFSESEGYTHELHPYDNRVFWFMTSSEGGLRISNAPAAGTPTAEVSEYDFLAVHENELVNLESSGRQWFGEQLSTVSPTGVFSFNLPDAVPGQPVQVSFSVAARATGSAWLSAASGDTEMAAKMLPSVDIDDAAAPYAVIRDFVLPGVIPGEDGRTDVTLTMGGSGGMAYVWLDWMRVLCRCRLTLRDKPLVFSDYYSVSPGRTVRYHITGAPAGTRVWDITDPAAVTAMPVVAGDGEATVTAGAATLRKYVAFHPGQQFLTPEWLPAEEAAVPNQDLLSLPPSELIIVTAPAFKAQAERIAGLHRSVDGMTVSVVTSQEVYNGFSGGKTDPAAVRNFLKYHYDRNGVLRYALLVGDGSYDNRGLDATSAGTQHMVTYQSANSLSSTESFTSDDYFAMLGDHESVLTGDMDICAGRLPVKSVEEAEAVTDKLARYMTESPWGEWRRTLCFMADDEDENTHLLQTEHIAEYLDQHHPALDIRKLYLDAYRQETTANGHRYPDVQTELKQNLKNGMLIFNYLGHGNETGLTNERVINEVDISTWDNAILPLFITASCEFGRYDNHMLVTAAEQLLLKPDGGAVALLSATRMVYSDLNSQLNEQFYHYAFAEDRTGRLGDMLRLAKNAADVGINARSFALLGDPALRLAAPQQTIRFTQLNGRSLAETGPLQAFSTVVLEGEVLRDGSVDGAFNGKVSITVCDKPAEQYTLDNDRTSGVTAFAVQPVLFKGSCTVVDGRFALTFSMPGDLSQAEGLGRITGYAWSETTDATGSAAVSVGGTAAPSATDVTGPDIRLFLNDTLFRDGGLAGEQPGLIALLHDPSGISVTTSAFGHRMQLQLTQDGGETRTWQVGGGYEADTDDATRGTLRWLLPTLSPGWYTLELTAWDLCGNMSTAALRFQSVRQRAVTVRSVSNYPNPFSEGTTFRFEHNQPAEAAEAVIRIYDLSGALLATLRQTIPAGGLAGEIHWNGRTGSGKKIGPGTYLYQLSLRFNDGPSVTRKSKFIVQ